MTVAYQIEQLYLFVFSLLVSIAILCLAKKKNFFVLPPVQKGSPLSFTEMILGFVSYLLFMLVLFPLFYLGIGYLFMDNLKGMQELSFEQQELFKQFAYVILALWLFLYSFLIKKESRQMIYWGGETPTWEEKKKGMVMGALSFVISYPLMLVVSLLVGFLSYVIFHTSGVEQLAVQQLKKTVGHPFLFLFMVINVVILVPFIEEFLFRGLLQSWLKRVVSRPLAILITAIVFSIVHFAPSQGVGNIELIAALFVLSCFLGFVYERQKMLLASMMMHGIFNGFSALMITLS